VGASRGSRDEPWGGDDGEVGAVLVFHSTALYTSVLYCTVLYGTVNQEGQSQAYLEAAVGATRSSRDEPRGVYDGEVGAVLVLHANHNLLCPEPPPLRLQPIILTLNVGLCTRGGSATVWGLEQ